MPQDTFPVAAMHCFLYTQQGEKHLKYTISLDSHNIPEKQSLLHPLYESGKRLREGKGLVLCRTTRRWQGEDPACSGSLEGLSPSCGTMPSSPLEWSTCPRDSSSSWCMASSNLPNLSLPSRKIRNLIKFCPSNTQPHSHCKTTVST